MAVFWAVAPCRLLRAYQRFGGLYCLHHQAVIRIRLVVKLRTVIHARQHWTVPLYRNIFTYSAIITFVLILNLTFTFYKSKMEFWIDHNNRSNAMTDHDVLFYAHDYFMFYFFLCNPFSEVRASVRLLIQLKTSAGNNWSIFMKTGKVMQVDTSPPCYFRHSTNRAAKQKQHRTMDLKFWMVINLWHSRPYAISLKRLHLSGGCANCFDDGTASDGTLTRHYHAVLTPCGLRRRYKRVGDAYCLHLQLWSAFRALTSSVLKTQIIRSLRKTTCKSTRRYNPED
jgi:hypothetical protein